MQVEKNIAFLINQQFPSYFREFGPELVKLTEEYYRFLETQTNQSNYVNRRMFEYRDISTTLQNMLIYYQKKYMADLPYKEDSIKILIRNIISLYRSKGTAAGIKTFFTMFYQEDVSIYYPAAQMLKPSNAKWRQGVYLQMFPNSDYFVSDTGKEYTYNDIIGGNILGSASGARAAVDKINFVVLNGILTPIIFIDGVKGTFEKYDDLLVNIDGEVIGFGRVSGSLSEFTVDVGGAKITGNQIGDIFDVESEFGRGGKAIVSEVSESFSGEISYTVQDGGFGFTKENTRLIVSDQVIVLDNKDLVFNIKETLVDTAGNEGIVVGQNENAVGVKMNTGDQFVIGRTISTADRSTNFDLNALIVSAKNSTSPGDQFADTADESDVKVRTLSNEVTVSLIVDPISNFLSTPLNASNYNDTFTMTGDADPVTLATVLEDAFDLTDFTIGTIVEFGNLLPGENYTNDAFAYAEDSTFSNFNRQDQIITFSTPAAAGSFNIGEEITEANTNISAVIRSTDATEGYITITPFAYYGFNGENDVVRGNGDRFNVIKVDTDYNSKVHGFNADIDAITEFATGKIKKVTIYDSGFGYVDESSANLVKDGDIYAVGQISVDTQGKSSGFWADNTSHLNGYQEIANNSLEYYDSGMKIQDSDFYQEYSYQIKSMLGVEQYEQLLKENVHLAGTKMFGTFQYLAKTDGGTKQRFYRAFNDDGQGSPLDFTPLDSLTADVYNFTVDSDEITVDDDSTV